MSDLQERAEALAKEAQVEIENAAQVVANAKMELMSATSDLHIACEVGDKLGLDRAAIAGAANQSENTVGQWIREERGIVPKKRTPQAEQIELPESEPPNPDPNPED